MSIVEHEPVVAPEKVVELDALGQILLRAAEIVRERWQQGSYGVHGGHRCLIGAISEAHGHKNNALISSVERTFTDILNKRIGFRGMPCVWNDTPGRTAEEVAEALERAAYGI